MRVISGSLRGRTIKGYDIEGTRPTMDRVKESIFAMIQEYIPGSIALDLFAGSGNLGIEAISNGSEFCYFVDNNPLSTRTILENSTIFKIMDKVHIYTMDYMTSLTMFERDCTKFDIIFIDPPYQNMIILQLLKALLNKNLISDKGIVVVEMEDNNIGSIEVEGYILLNKRTYGEKTVNIYQRT